VTPRFKTARAVAALVLALGFFVGAAGLVVGLIWAGAELGGLVTRYARGTALIFGGGLVLALMSVAGVVAWALFPGCTASSPRARSSGGNCTLPSSRRSIASPRAAASRVRGTSTSPLT
jgi:hypothetical protein